MAARMISLEAADPSCQCMKVVLNTLPGLLLLPNLYNTSE